VGLGWRHPHYTQMLEQRPALDFLEVHSENFFHAGGAALAVLEQGRAHYPISLHGVGLSLGSAAGVDLWHLDQLAALVRRIDPVRVSDHASFARASLPGATVHAADLLPVPFSTEALGVMCANVQLVQDRLQRPIWWKTSQPTCAGVFRRPMWHCLSRTFCRSCRVARDAGYSWM